MTPLIPETPASALPSLSQTEPKDLGLKEEPSDSVISPGQNHNAPAFDKPEEEVEYAWWSWHPRYPYWSRSCWDGKTEQEAREAVAHPLAAGMRNYQNVLVRESKRFTVIRPSVVEGNASGGATRASSENLPAPLSQTDEEIAREVAKVIGECVRYALRSFPAAPGSFDEIENNLETIILAAITKSRGVQQEEKTSGEKEADVNVGDLATQIAGQMEVVDAGHAYRLPSFDGELFQTLTFMKREGDGYPGNVGHYPGTNLQSVLRACLDRVVYLQDQIPHENNIAIICHLRHCLRELEQRAAERHGFNANAITLDLASQGAMCVVCGHVLCGHSVGRASTQGAPLLTPNSSAPSVQQEDTVRLEGKDLG